MEGESSPKKAPVTPPEASPVKIVKAEDDSPIKPGKDKEPDEDPDVKFRAIVEATVESINKETDKSFLDRSAMLIQLVEQQ